MAKQKDYPDISRAAEGETARKITEAAKSGFNAAVDTAAKVLGWSIDKAKEAVNYAWSGEDSSHNNIGDAVVEYKDKQERSGGGNNTLPPSEKENRNSGTFTNRENYDPAGGGEEQESNTATTDTMTSEREENTMATREEPTKSRKREGDGYKENDLEGPGDMVDSLEGDQISQLEDSMSEDPIIDNIIANKSSARGRWDSADTAALRTWQRKYGEAFGIEATGRLDKKTYEVLTQRNWRREAMMKAGGNNE